MIKPILFSTPMVQAILAGKKTQTRRVIKTPPCEVIARGNTVNVYKATKCDRFNNVNPPYQIGDVLWVRETWQAVYETEYNDDHPSIPTNIRDIIVNFDNLSKTFAGLSSEWSCQSMEPRNKWFVYKATPPAYKNPEYGELYWKSSAHMPKEAARIFLRVTNVRVGRLQDINEKHAIAEGVEPMTTPNISGVGKTYIQGFAELWNDTFAKRGFGWDTNPWVWVIDFERCEKPEGWPA